MSIPSAWRIPNVPSDTQVEQDQRNTFTFHDDFIAGLSTAGNVGIGWTIAGGTVASSTAMVPGTFGLIQRATGGTINTVATTLLGFAVFYADETDITIYGRFKHDQVDTTVTHRFGLYDLASTATAQPVSGVYFEKKGADTNWFAVCRSAGVETRVNTDVAATATGFHLFEVIHVAGSPDVFKIDGVRVATISTNLPGHVSSMIAFDTINLEAVTKTVQVDCVGGIVPNLNRA